MIFLDYYKETSVLLFPNWAIFFFYFQADTIILQNDLGASSIWFSFSPATSPPFVGIVKDGRLYTGESLTLDFKSGHIYLSGETGLETVRITARRGV